VKCEDDLSRIHASFTDGKFGFVPWDAFILELKILACSFGLKGYETLFKVYQGGFYVSP